jgi:hypothetical protein
MQNHHITKLLNIKLQSYKLHVIFCKLKIKLQVHVCKYEKLPNYQITKITKITKLQITGAFLHIYKFAHAKFACFHTCMYYKIIRL